MEQSEANSKKQETKIYEEMLEIAETMKMVNYFYENIEEIVLGDRLLVIGVNENTGEKDAFAFVLTGENAGENGKVLREEGVEETLKSYNYDEGLMGKITPRNYQYLESQRKKNHGFELVDSFGPIHE